jgi:hypothetical protein
MVALVFGKPFHSAMADSKAPVTADVSQPVADQGLATEAVSFVTSPTIDTNSEFFFGSGDGSSGYYAAEPPEPRLALVRYERMPYENLEPVKVHDSNTVVVTLGQF